MKALSVRSPGREEQGRPDDPGPRVELLADELRPVVQSDRLQHAAVHPDDPLQRLHQIRFSIALL